MNEPPTGTFFPYDLKRKNYDDLRHADYQVPRILVVVVCPVELSQWLEATDHQLLLRHSAWWFSLRGLPASTNATTVRVQVPTSQRFDPPSLLGIMERVGNANTP